LAWPVATLLVGLLCGVTAFAEEQQGGHLRFLSDQRLPPGRVWAVQVGSRLLAAVVLALGLLVLAAGSGWADANTGLHVLPTEIRLTEYRTQHLEDVFGQMGPAAFLSLWLLHGFAFGQLFALLARKSIVAVTLALLTAVPAAAVWVPELAG